MNFFKILRKLVRDPKNTFVILVTYVHFAIVVRYWIVIDLS